MYSRTSPECLARPSRYFHKGPPCPSSRVDLSWNAASWANSTSKVSVTTELSGSRSTFSAELSIMTVFSGVNRGNRAHTLLSGLENRGLQQPAPRIRSHWVWSHTNSRSSSNDSLDPAIKCLAMLSATGGVALVQNASENPRDCFSQRKSSRQWARS